MEKEVEIWKPVYEFEDRYEVSNLGRIRNTKTKKIHGTQINKGYVIVSLFDGNKNYTRQVHRIVLSSFKPIENMNNYQVNHIDENKFNNNLNNLEWLSPKDNVNYGTGVQRRAETQQISNSTRREVINLDTKEQYISIRDCARITGIDRASIWRCVNKRQYTAGGYHWQYLDEFTESS